MLKLTIGKCFHSFMARLVSSPSNMWTLCDMMWPACAEFDVKPSVFGHLNEGVLAWDG